MIADEWSNITIADTYAKFQRNLHFYPENWNQVWNGKLREAFKTVEDFSYDASVGVLGGRNGYE